MSAYLNAVKEYDDVRRTWLIVESDDWDAINPALEEWGNMIPALIMTGGTNAVATTLRILVESIYVRGYERGRADAGT